MIKLQVFAALLGVAFLGACKAPDTTSRMDTTTFAQPLAPVAMSATRDLREPSQSLAAVAMKDMLFPGEALHISDRARAIIADYAD
jgi:uncharacterized lipoprotein YajG